jgi:large subunit ribosomal protein L10
MRPEKQSILREIEGELKGAKYVILTDYRGLKSEQMTALRAQVRSNNANMKVVKNTLLGSASRQTGVADFGKSLTGPTAMITGQGDITAMAKILKAFIDENKLPVVKGGVFAGKAITPADVDEMAALPPIEILMGMMVGTVAAPMQRLVGAMNQKLSSLLYVLKAIEEKKTSGK